jgi:hypothetical protein
MKTIKIYALIDPRTDDIRYVGKTNQPLPRRLSAHLIEKSKCHRCNWISELKRFGLVPLIEIIEEVKEGINWQEREIFWIKHLRIVGFNLTNNTSGGDGVPDLPKETREKIRRASLGRKHKPETIEKYRETRRGKIHTEEHKQYMREKMTGRKNTWGDKVSVAMRKLTVDDANTILKRIKDGDMIKDIAADYKMHRTSISKIKMGTYFDKDKYKK